MRDPEQTDPDEEVLRLRALVGPSEFDYAELCDDLAAASAATRAAVLAAGELRGRLTEMSVELARARHDQDRFQRRREMSAVEYLVDLARECWTEVLRPRVGRIARRAGLRRT